jgi:hypothetical protein
MTDPANQSGPGGRLRSRRWRFPGVQSRATARGASCAPAGTARRRIDGNGGYAVRRTATPPIASPRSCRASRRPLRTARNAPRYLTRGRARQAHASTRSARATSPTRSRWWPTATATAERLRRRASPGGALVAARRTGPGRRKRQRDLDGQLVANWVDVFGPVVLLRPRRRPAAGVHGGRQRRVPRRRRHATLVPRDGGRRLRGADQPRARVADATVRAQEPGRVGGTSST